MAAKLTSQRRIEEVLYFPIQLSDQINESLKEAKKFKPDCSYVAKKVDRIRQMLYSVYRHATSAAPFYSHPLRRIASDVSKNLEESLTLVRKCRRDSFIVRLVATVSEADFRKSFSLLDSSAADLKWVISVFKFGVVAGGIVLSLPPIAVHNPMISWVWSFITSLHIGRLQDKIDAAAVLASLAEDNDRNKRIIVEEGGVSPLLKLLNDSSSIEGQIAAASTLGNLAKNIEGVRAIIDQSGVPIIVQVLDDSPTEVQIPVVNLVATMAEHCPLEQEDLARGNAMMCLLPTIISQGKMTTKNQLIASCVNGTADWPYRYDECLMQSTARIAQPLPSLQNDEVYGEVMHEETYYQRYYMVNDFQLYQECVLVFEVKQAPSFNSRGLRGSNPEYPLQIDDDSGESDNEDVVEEGNANNANVNANNVNVNVNANDANVNANANANYANEPRISFSDELNFDDDSSTDGSVVVDYKLHELWF